MLMYYNSLVFFQVFVNLIMFLIISSDNLIDTMSKQYFKKVFLVLTLMILAEWFSIYCQSYELGDAFFHESLYSIVLCLAPLIIHYLGRAFTKTKLSIPMEIFIVINLFLQISLLFSDKYFVLPQHFLAEGNLYVFYNIILIISIMSMLNSMVVFSKRRQTKNTYILFLIISTYFVGNILQMINPVFIMNLLCANFVTIFIYGYYSSIINKIDMLTKLLNRKSFEHKVAVIKKDCVVIIIDLNKFKLVNDMYGHSCGDIVLKKISDLILDVYGKYGNCYRIGGDEFCIVLEKNLDNVQVLNKKLTDAIIEERKNEPNLTSVSIGYCRYNNNENDINETIKSADVMMYAEKNSK